MKCSIQLILFVLVAGQLNAQNYSAIHGSNYFGSLGVYNNPSTIVNSPYKWDLTILGMQYQTISNAVKGPNFPLNLTPNAKFYGANGNFKRYADLNLNMHLLNGRYSLDKSHAFAFGVNIRGYTQAATTKLNFTDSVKGPRSFLSLNEQNRSIEINLASSAWLEIYGSYGLNIWDRETSSLNGGASFKISRSLAGGFVKVNNVQVEKEQLPNDEEIYKIAQGNARYGYSANLGDGTSISPSDFLSGSKTGFAVDLGVEYLVKTQAVTNVYDDDNAGIEYEWKIGVSLLDLGWNQFAYSSESRSVSVLEKNISSGVLTQKFADTKDLGSFNDSLATIVTNIDPLTGNFKIMNPARAVVNVDRYVQGNIYVNAELALNLASNEKNNIAVKESRLVTITPRWETRKFGVYVPVQYTRHGNIWIGGAVKIGPLLLGTHNLLNTFFKNKYLGGGAYLAFTLRPSSFIRDARSRQYDCPVY